MTHPHPSPNDAATLALLLFEMDFSGFHFKKVFMPEHLELKDENGWPLLHHAAHNGATGSLAIMLPLGGPLANELDHEGWSPAMLAASSWNDAILRSLSPWTDHALATPSGLSLAMLCAGDAKALTEVIEKCDLAHEDAQGHSLLDHLHLAYHGGQPDPDCLAMVERRLLELAPAAKRGPKRSL